MKNINYAVFSDFVGILFIISGLIKFNDPIGFSYKLTEYFSEPVLLRLFFKIVRVGTLVSLEIVNFWRNAVDWL
jgi:hypothetical protein